MKSIPGHAWQFTFSHKLPLIRTLCGSSTLISKVMLSMPSSWLMSFGLYEDNPLGRLGRLNDLKLRACRLVVDTGLHTKHWSRNQAIAWLRERLGFDQK